MAAYRAYGALGSDTGGSVRLPASYCGVVGFKPTYGQVSRWGLIAYASSLDTVGVLARRVGDCRAVYRVIAGPDAKDSTCLPSSPRTPLPSPPPSLSSLRVGVPLEANVAELSDEMRQAWLSTIDALRDAGATVVTVSLPHTSVALSAYYILAPAEASSNLARYDGIRYGHSASPPSPSPPSPSSSGPPRQSLHSMIAANRGEGFGPEVQRRILLGTFVLSSAAYSTYFVKAQQVRQLIADDYARVLGGEGGVDVLLTPTAVGCAPTLEEVREGGLRGWVNDVMTVGVSLAGLPAVSVPVGVGRSSGLPLGMQVIGRWREDERLLDVAELLEQLMRSKTGHVIAPP